MAIVGSRIWYHPRWFARYVPDPDIEGKRLGEKLAEAALAGEPTSVGTAPASGGTLAPNEKASTRSE